MKCNWCVKIYSKTCFQKTIFILKSALTKETEMMFHVENMFSI